MSRSPFSQGFYVSEPEEAAGAYFDPLWLLLIAVLVLLAGFLLTPILEWREVSGLPLTAYLSRTSFHFQPGELIPKKPSVQLSVVIPCYNEELRLPAMLKETFYYLDRRCQTQSNFSYEVIVVDDGSRDGTYAVALASSGGCQQGNVRVVQHADNRGKGFAVRTGVLIARGQWVLMADADGSTPVSDVARLESAMQRHPGGQCLAFGSRYHQWDELRHDSPCGGT
jgi:dolichyl-phosphate beta-glucosyltransferase